MPIRAGPEDKRIEKGLLPEASKENTGVILSKSSALLQHKKSAGFIQGSYTYS
jgi:hypothetical protein